jgi:signal transduction histidine kinase
MMMVQSAYSALQALFGPPGRLLRVLARPRFESGEFIEIVIAEAPLKRDMRVYAIRVLALSIITSVFTAWLVYLTLNAQLVRPMRRLTTHIERFRDRPEDVSNDIRPSGRQDEIGRAESALAAMELQVRNALRQRERLAGLGAAVAKLAHDMRNSLATAQLVSERLAASDDPKVRQTAPRLERVIARAGGLAEAALRYGRADEPAPLLQRVPLAHALEEAAADALAPFPGAAWRPDVASETMVFADAEHLHRIFVNLIRNAAQVSQCAGKPVRVAARAHAEGETLTIEFADAGPGVSDQARARLFEPFAAAGRNGGAGLGLAIARELARAMGGEVALVSSSGEGAVFAVNLRSAMGPER